MTSKQHTDLDVVIVGAGFAGMYALYRLRDDLGLNARVYERGDGVGGTWFWNRYPGARCDSESFYYCYSFSKELEQEWEWSSRYPAQPEILSYLEHVAERFDLYRDIQLATGVKSAHFDEDGNYWRVTLDNGEMITARYFVSAVGCLSAANIPDIPGLESFTGEWYHTGDWPKDGVDFTGKRVGQIGTGSTGIQAAPMIAAEADHLTVFQRTASFSVPARNRPYEPGELDEIKTRYDEINALIDQNHGGFPFVRTDRSGKDVSEEERQEIFEQLWQDGGFKFLWGSFYDLLVDSEVNDAAANFIRDKIRSIVKDPEVAERLVPRGYPYGAKRPPIDTDYFATYNRDNVSLVDLNETPITQITETGIQTEGEHYPLDTIVFATGFDAMTGSLLKMDIRGIGGQKLADKWEAGPTTYLGLQVSGFPNLFIVTGPGSPSVLTNMPRAIEQHVDWIADCIAYMRDNEIARIHPTPAAEQQWVAHVNEIADFTLYSKAKSWYVGANIPGKVQVFMPYVGGQPMYREKCQQVVANGYEGFELTA